MIHFKYTNCFPSPALRAGREGVKMSLDLRCKGIDEFANKIWWQNYNRLQTWCNIGSDVENGFGQSWSKASCEMTVLLGH